MQNPFLLIRSVFLALMTFLGLLTIIFATWNINASIAATDSVSGTSVFIVFESSTHFFCVVLAFAEVFRPSAQTSNILFECGWNAVLALFQIGATISTTINGPAFLCREPLDQEVCASASLLVPSMWLKTFVSFSYFFSVFIVSLAHRRAVPRIWNETMYTMQWFKSPSQRIGQMARVDLDNASLAWDKGSIDEENPYSRYLDAIDSSSARKKTYPVRNSIDVSAPWAQNTAVRRGIDNPFAKALKASPVATDATLPEVAPLNLPSPKLGPLTSRFIEKFRESRILSRAETPSQYGTHFTNSSSNMFPPTVPDHDKPIPLPRLSEWVRADALHGVSVHTVPLHSPSG